MGIEIERKFLVRGTPWKSLHGTRIVQAYLNSNDSCTVRVRIAGNNAWITLKGPKTGISRSEFEYPIPINDAELMLHSLATSPPIEKIRYTLPSHHHTWEIDVFTGLNNGLVVAEIELNNENEPFPHPNWLGKEVTHDPKYQNSSLANHPFQSWKD